MMLAGIIQLRKPDVVCLVSGEAAVCVRACTCVCVHARWRASARTCTCALSHVQLSAALWTVARQTPLSRESPGKSTGVGCYFLLLGIFPTQGSNPCLSCLLHRQTSSLPLSHWGSHVDQKIKC